jgi:hypothetical protein
MKLFSIVIAFFTITLTASGQTPKDVSVCDLLAKMSEWNGQMVRFDAKIEKGTGEQGPWINALDCPTKIKVGEVEFPNGLELTDPDSPNRLHEVTFERDLESRVEFRALLSRVDRKTEYIRGTVVGVFETQTPISRLVGFSKAWPKGFPLGFGHLGAAPAQILIKTTTNIRIEKRNDGSVNVRRSGEDTRRGK